ncbi:MAG: hypothetical protein WBC05_25870, partial [Sedimentisphaerales bacterium]
EINKLRKDMLGWMKKTGDPALNSFENRTSPEALKNFMAEQDAKSGSKKSKKETSKTSSRKQRSG